MKVKNLLLALAIIVSTGTASSCAGAHQNATIAIVAAGGVVNEIQALHHAAYQIATDRLRARVLGSTQYDVEVIPIDAEYAARGAEIQALATALISAATVTDSVQSGDPVALQRAAASVLATLERAIVVLQRGGALPAIEIPSTVVSVVAGLRVLAGGAR